MVAIVKTRLGGSSSSRCSTASFQSRQLGSASKPAAATSPNGQAFFVIETTRNPCCSPRPEIDSIHCASCEAPTTATVISLARSPHVHDVTPSSVAPKLQFSRYGEE